MSEDKDKELVWDETGFGDLRILQDRRQFSYGVDAVLLGDFAAGFINEGKNGSDPKKAVDLGTGTGIIPLILAHKTPLAEVIGLDVEKYFVDLAKKTAAANGLNGRVFYGVADVSMGIDSLGDFGESRDFGDPEGFDRLGGLKKPGGSDDIGNLEFSGNKTLAPQSVDFVTCNPPYFKADGSLASPNPMKDAARRESKGKLKDFCNFAGEILKPGGEFFLIHRPERLVDVFFALRNSKLEPRDMRMISSQVGGKPKLVLIRSIKGGGPNLRWMSPLWIYEEDGTYTRKLMEIYEK